MLQNHYGRLVVFLDTQLDWAAEEQIPEVHRREGRCLEEFGDAYGLGLLQTSRLCTWHTECYQWGLLELEEPFLRWP